VRAFNDFIAIIIHQLALAIDGSRASTNCLR
jgi:hypothetical protein